MDPRDLPGGAPSVGLPTVLARPGRSPPGFESRCLLKAIWGISCKFPGIASHSELVTRHSTQGHTPPGMGGWKHGRWRDSFRGTFGHSDMPKGRGVKVAFEVGVGRG